MSLSRRLWAESCRAGIRKPSRSRLEVEKFGFVGAISGKGCASPLVVGPLERSRSRYSHPVETALICGLIRAWDVIRPPLEASSRVQIPRPPQLAAQITPTRLLTFKA